MSSGPPGRVGAIVVAAGSSSRMGLMDKVFAPLAGRPLVSHSIDIIEGCECIERTVLVLSERRIREGTELVHRFGWRKVAIAQGGRRRQDSVGAGLAKLKDMDWIVVHDGARPFLTAKMIDSGLASAARTGAAVAAVRVKDTIKVVDTDMTVTSTPERSGLWVVQTPQVFSLDVLVRAHSQVAEEVTDDASMVERMGGTVSVFEGAYANLKVTTPEDLDAADHLLTRRDSAAGGETQMSVDGDA